MSRPPDDGQASRPARPLDPARKPPRRGWRRVLSPWALLPGLLVLALSGGGLWLATTPAGARFALGWIPGLSWEGLAGSWTEGLTIERLEWTAPTPPGAPRPAADSPPRTVRVEGLRFSAPQWALSPSALTWGRLTIDRVEAWDIAVTGAADAAPGPPVLPASLALPIEVLLPDVSVARLRLPGQAVPIEALHGSLALGDDDGRTHRLTELRARWGGLQAGGAIGIDTQAPLQLDARVVFGTATSTSTSPMRPAPPGEGAKTFQAPPEQAWASGLLGDQAWEGRAQALGPLAAFDLDVQLQAAGQSLTARARVAPGQAWPLPELQVDADGLDLSALSGRLPSSRLSGRVRIEPSADTAATPRPPAAVPQARDPNRRELHLSLDLRNGRPLALSSGGLPIARLQAQARVDAADPMAGITIPTLEATLADAAGAAGRIQGSGAWEGPGAHIDVRVDGLSLRSLDAGLPAMRLSGPLSLKASGWTEDPATASAEARVEWRGESTLTGRGRVPVQIQGEVQAGLSALQVRGLVLQVGSARAEGRMQGRRSPAARGAAPRSDLRAHALSAASDAWQLDGELLLSGFDPGHWMRAQASPTRPARSSRLTGTARWALQWPAARPGQAASERLAGASGDASLVLAPGSDLLGVPVQGDVRLSRADGRASLQGLAAFDAAGNRLKLDLQADPRRLAGSNPSAGRPDGAPGPGAGERPDVDRLDLTLDADALGALRPWWQALGGPSSVSAAADWGGAAQLQLRALGRWPLLQTEGSLRAQALRAAGLFLGQAEGRWQVAPRAGEPVSAEFEFQDARRGTQTLDRGRLVVGGTLDGLQLSLEAVARAVPPAWLRLLGEADREATRDERSRWTLAANARWMPPAPASLSGPAAEDRIHPAMAAWAQGQPTRWTVTDLRARVSPVRADGRPAGSPSPAPGPGAGNRLPIEWVAFENASVDIELPGRPQRVAAPATPADTTARSALQLRSGPGLLRSNAATLRWTSWAWQPASAGQPERLALEASLDGLPVAPLLQRLQPGFGWGGDLLIGGRFAVRSHPSVPRQLEAMLQVERLGGDLQVDEAGSPQPLGLSELRLFAQAQDGVWKLGVGVNGTRLGRFGGEAQVEAAADSPWPSLDAPLRGRLTSQVADLGIWGAWVPAGWRLAGQLRSDLAVGGTLRSRRFTGELRGEQLAVRHPLLGVAITEGELAVSLQGDRAVVEAARAKAGGGRLEITGGTNFAAHGAITELAVVAERFQVIGRVDRRIVASGRGQIRLSPEALRVDGRFGVDEGLIDFSRRDAPTLSEDVVVDGQQPADDGGEESAGAGAAARLQLAVDLQVDLGERLRVRGRGLDTGLRGNLRLTSPANQLALHGTVRTVDGTYAAYGQKLAITRGNLVFSGPPDRPRLDIEATRPDVDVVVGVSIVGPAALPRVRLISEPEMSETEKLSWLMLGRGSDGLGRTDAALLQRAAFAFLAGEDGDANGPLGSLFGLDTLSVRPGDGESSRDTVVTLGKQLNRRWYVGYERGLNATAGNFQLIYRLARRFTLRAQSGEDNSLDLIWTWRWQ